MLDVVTHDDAPADAIIRGRVALVMGAGGPVGHGFHAGVLAALHDVWNWDARSAELIVGTSAGAGVGALVRAGLSGHDLVSRVTGQPLPPSAEAIARHYHRPRTVGEEAPARRWPGSARYIARACLQPWAARPGRLVAALLPQGRMCTQKQAHGLREIFGEEWPEQNLWITAVGLDCGSRVAFGREDAPKTDVGTAVICSSAVPSVCLPIEVGEGRYIDGGIASPTHLDLIEDAPQIETVIVSSPLSRMPGMRGLLRREMRRLRRNGVNILAVEPGPQVIDAMGWNPMDPARVAKVAEAARSEFGRTLTNLTQSAKLRGVHAEC